MEQSELKVIERLLGIKDVRVIGYRETVNNEAIITVESKSEVVYCQHCSKPCVAHGRAMPIQIQHLPLLGKTTYIEISPPRGKCKYCDKGPTTTQKASWYNWKAKGTIAYEDWAMLMLINSTIEDVSLKLETTPDIIRGIMDKRVHTKVNWDEIEKIGILGIDEVSLKKHHQQYVTLIYSRYNGVNKIIKVLEGRSKESIKNYLLTIPKKQKKTIKCVCTDMCDGIVNAAEEAFKNYKIAVVCDRFHVVQLYRKKFVKLRSNELKRIRKELSEKQYKKLQGAISILSKNNYHATAVERETLKKLFKHSPKLKQAYDMSYKLSSIYNSKIGKKKGYQKMTDFIEELETMSIKEFGSFIKTFRKHRSRIANFFASRSTSGFVEGLNNKFKILKRRSYGLFDVFSIFQRLYLDISGYSVFGANREFAMAA